MPDDGPAALLAPQLDLSPFSPDIRNQAAQLLAELQSCRQLHDIKLLRHQLAYLLNVFGPDRILMGTDYPYDMAEYNPIGHIAGVDGMDETTLAQLAGGNAMRLLDR